MICRNSRRYIPNLKIADTSVTTNIYMRGIGSGQDRGFEQSVGLFVDGIYMGRSKQYRAPFLDVQRVEVLRGPQPVMFWQEHDGGGNQDRDCEAETGRATVGRSVGRVRNGIRWPQDGRDRFGIARSLLWVAAGHALRRVGRLRDQHLPGHR